MRNPPTARFFRPETGRSARPRQALLSGLSGYRIVTTEVKGLFVGATLSPSKTGVNALVVVARRAAHAERRAGTRPAPTNRNNPFALLVVCGN
jgi:hypothetical protein